MKYDKTDLGVTSVIGEMLILVLVIILVSLFATSAFNLLPGDREQFVNVAMNQEVIDGELYLLFYHKGGDWISRHDLTVTATRKTDGRKETLSIQNVTDYKTNFKNDPSNATLSVFDLGGALIVPITDLPLGSYEIRIATLKSVIFSGEVTR